MTNEEKEEIAKASIEPSAAIFLKRVISGEFGPENIARDTQLAMVQSCAISLKRIADALERGGRVQ
ncbi:MAG: hypothetical protein ACJ75S_06940 [Solirubrobacterales bacterium]|jgi:hypothetical protein